MNILAINSFYIVTLIIILLCFLYIAFIFIMQAIKQKLVKKAIITAATENNLDYEIINSKENGISFILKTKEKQYNIKVLSVPKNCDLQINNIDTWVIYKKTFGSSTLTCKTIDNMTDFMNSKLENRIVILTSQAKTIKKVINECEMIMVKPDTNIYGVNILNNNQIDLLFSKNKMLTK